MALIDLFRRSRAPERRSYTDSMIASAEDSAGRISGAGRTSAVAIASSLWGRALAAAEVRGDLGLTTPEMLQSVGRSLIRRGQWIGRIEVDPPGIQPAADWTISGGASPASWRYLLTMPGPSDTISVDLPAAGVIDLRWECDQRRPWEGIGPLENQRLNSQLLGALEGRLSEEASGPVGHLLTVPSLDGAGMIGSDIKALRGGAVLIESVASWGDGGQASPKRDWEPTRLGADPPAALVQLHEQAVQTTLAACGVPAVLALGRADGTMLRESWRQFLFGSVAPMAKLIAAELSAKLETEVSLEFGELRASDLTGRARAYASMVSSGMDRNRAEKLAGLSESM